MHDRYAKTRLYNTLMGNPQINNAVGRTAGATAAQGSDDNFFVKRGKSIENALGTTAAALKESGGNLLGAAWAGLTGSDYTSHESQKRKEQSEGIVKDLKKQMNDTAKNFGYETWDDWSAAYAAANDEGDQEKIARFKEQNKAFQDVANAGAAAAEANANDYEDYRNNNYVSKKINQDNGKFAGSAINTLSTAVDLTGLGATPISNAIQGGFEGLADELEANGGNLDIGKLKITGGDNFSWERAGQNALIGATTGAVTGALNKGVSGALAKRAAAKGLTDTAVKGGVGTAIKNGAKTLASGAARGALSGAVGGATGAGLSSALNGVEFGQGVQNALQGAVQGAKQGAVTGATMAGANMAISKTPGVGKLYNEIQSAKQNWDNIDTGDAKTKWDKFNKRFTETMNSGDSRIGNWLNRQSQSKVLGAAGNIGNTIDVDTNTREYDAWDRLAQQKGYDDYDQVIERYMEANPDVELNPRGAAGQILTWLDKNPNTPTTLGGWAKRAGERIVEDANNRGVGLGVKDVSEDMPEDIQNMNIRDYNANADEQNNGMTERLKGSLRSSDGRAANMLKNMPGKLGDKYNDWLAEPAQIEEFGPRYTQFSGDPEAARDYLMRRQQGEVPRASYNQSLEDLNGDGFVDYVYGKPGEGEEYSGGYGLAHIQAKHGDEALNRVPSNIENGVAEEQPFGRYYLTNGSNDDLTVVKDSWKADSKSPSIKKQWLATSYELDNPVSRGTVSSDSSTARTSAGSGEFDTPANSIVTQNNKDVNSNPQTQLYNSLTTGKTSKGAKLRNAEGMRLAQQYGTIDKPTAKATNPSKVFTDLAELGFTKPADVERMAGAMTGSNGEMSALVRNVVQAADPVDTFVGEKSGQTLDDYINLSIQKHGLDGINEGKAVKSQINALMKSLPSHAEGSIDFVDTPESVFKLTQQLDAEAANYRGKSGMNYGTTTPDKLRAAQVMNDVSNLLKNRIYSTSDVRQALTPEVAQNLKAYAPNNKAWADYVDNTVMKMENVKDLRSAQANWVNANKIIDNAYINSMTYGGRVGGNGSPIPLTKRGLAGEILGKTINSGPALRTRAKVLGKAADFADKMSGSNTSTAPVNPQVATPAELANTVSDYNPSTQLYNAIGRTEGLTNAEQARTANYLADAAQEAEVVPNTNATNVPSLYGTNATNVSSYPDTGTTSLYNSLYGTPTATLATVQTSNTNTGYFQPTGDYWTDIIASAMSAAIDADDVNAFATLYGMYQDQLANLQKQASAAQSSSQQKLTSTQQRANAAMNSLERLSGMEPDTAYNLSGIPLIGNIATFGGNDYEAEAKSLAQQIGYMVSGSNIKDSEAENIGKSYVPQPWDNEQVRQNKLRRAYEIIQRYQNGYAE